MSLPTKHNNSPSPYIAKMEPDELRDHMAALGTKSNAVRITLSSEEVAALGNAYRLIDRIYRRHEAKLAAAAEDGGAG